MHGEILPMWLNKLKIAVIEKNTRNINELLDDIPKLENNQDIEEALYLLREAAELIYTLKDETSLSMAKMKKNISFLRSMENAPKNKLDLKS